MPEIIVKLDDNVIQKYFFVNEPMHIGRVSDNEIVIENLSVSRNHALITHEDGCFLITDLGSSNGTIVNGVRVKKTEIMDRDVIAIGKHKLYFYDQRAAAPDNLQRVTAFDGDRTMMVMDAPLVPEGELLVTKGRQKGQRFKLHASPVTIGRGVTNDIRLTDWFVSREHALIERREQFFFIRDLESWRHTMVNGEAINESPLTTGDVIHLGPTVQLTFSVTVKSPDPRPSMRHPVELDEDGIRASLENPPITDVTPGALEIEDQDESTANHYAGADPDFISPPVIMMREVMPDMVAHAELDALLGAAIDAAPQPWPDDPASQASSPPPVPLNGCSASFEIPAAEPADWAAAFFAESLELPTPTPSATNGAVELPRAEDAPAWATTPVAPVLPVAEAKPADAACSAPMQSALDDEIRLWERALRNESLLIRKQAARRLKQLTGKAYDY